MRMRVQFDGRVQGVGFRATANAVAGRHRVTGWVRNERDGTVLMEVQGSQEAVDGYLEDLRATMARYITAVRDSKLADVTGEAGFEIRYRG